jgi:hypothetical protein
MYTIHQGIHRAKRARTLKSSTYSSMKYRFETKSAAEPPLRKPSRIAHNPKTNSSVQTRAFPSPNSRKESIFNLGSAETKLLYTLHWVLLDAGDECALEEVERRGRITANSYNFPVSSVTVRQIAGGNS